MTHKPIIFSGSSHGELAVEVAGEAGLELGALELGTFPDGEIFVQVDESVRGRQCYVVQSIARRPNHYLVELLALVDALKRASAASVVAILPYFGYARQDRRGSGRVPITARLVADLLETAGVTQVVTLDLHSQQIQGFFDLPVDNLVARSVLVEAVQNYGVVGSEWAVACPDIGSIKIARSVAKALEVDLAVVDKERLSPREVEVTTLIGDVAGKKVLLVDDLVATGGSLLAAATRLYEAGALSVVAAATHGLFVDGAIDRLESSGIEKIWVTNSLPVVSSAKVEVVSVGPLIGNAIQRMISARSLTPLFQ